MDWLHGSREWIRYFLSLPYMCGFYRRVLRWSPGTPVDVHISTTSVLALWAHMAVSCLFKLRLYALQIACKTSSSPLAFYIYIPAFIATLFRVSKLRTWSLPSSPLLNQRLYRPISTNTYVTQRIKKAGDFVPTYGA